MRAEELIKAYDAMRISEEKLTYVMRRKPRTVRQNAGFRRYLPAAAGVLAFMCIVCSIGIYSSRKGNVTKLPVTEVETVEESLNAAEYMQEAGLIANAEDYESLLEVMGDDYLTVSVKELEDRLLAWEAEENGRMERIVRAGAAGAGRTNTVLGMDMTSREEMELRLVTGYIVEPLYQAIQDGNAEDLGAQRIFDNEWTELRREFNNEDGSITVFRLNYGFSYEILDLEMKVSEKESYLWNVLNEVNQWFEFAELEELNALEKQDVAERMKKIVEECENESIAFEIEESQILFAKTVRGK